MKHRLLVYANANVYSNNISYSFNLSSFPLTVALALMTTDKYLTQHSSQLHMAVCQCFGLTFYGVWGHPEVYIVIPSGVWYLLEFILSTFARKRLFGHQSMVWATAGIAFLSFFSLVHHFFTMGNGALINSFFSISTMLIGIPTGVKIFNWLLTLYKGRISF